MGYAHVVRLYMGNAIHGKRVDIQFEEREKNEKSEGMDYGSTCANVGCLERETRELLKV